eukprot:TRINITY_DN1847_c0_g1_i1.p1 TRINITY_DN1847_c0_g1~~TRINITY_DN1847_c0_g1_i1.p1  ORF type:complete len:255 (-),score=31.69 TRINITY_DN1847_c0_g1_i1:163-927(-)
MPLPDKDFDVTETSIPYNYLKLSVPNIEIEFSTENGNVAECDPLLLTGVIFGKLGASEEAKGYYAEMIQSEAFQHPIPYRDLDMERYDAIILPGGHAKGMRQYLESQTLRDKILPFFLRCTEGGDKVCAAICHGTLVLARTIDPTTQKSVLFNLKTTTLPKYMEFNAYMITFWKLGDYYRTYPVYLQDEIETNLSSPKTQMLVGPSNLFGRLDAEPHVVVDGNYVSARWPGDAKQFAKVLGEKLLEIRRTKIGH